MEQKIGYRHLEGIMETSDLPEERKEAWKKFEYVREKLYSKYRELIKKDLRSSNTSLEIALREITCRASNRDTSSVIKQWKEIIERYTQKEKNKSVRVALLKILNQFLNEE